MSAVVTFLVVLSVVASVLVAPVAAGDDLASDDEDGVTVGTDDDDGVTVGTDDTTVTVNESSVSADAGGSSVSVDTDGVAPDDGTSDADESPLDGAETADDDTLPEPPVNYSDVPFEDLPVDVCNPPVDPRDPPGSPVDPYTPPEQWPDDQDWPVPSTPVNPQDPLGAPFGVCAVFNVSDPPFDPTNPPQDPGYSTDTDQSDPSRYLISGGATLDRNESGPSVGVITGGHTGENRTSNAQRTTVNDGEKDYALFTQVRWVPGTREGAIMVEPTVVGRSVDATIVCDGEECTFSSGGTPAPSQSIPTGGGDGNDSGGANYSDIPFEDLPVDVCSPPVDPRDPPGSPVNPYEPPEQWPGDQDWPVPATPVNPNDPPGAPFGHCAVFDPTDPPFDPSDPPQDPDYSTDTDQSDPSRYLISGGATLDNNESGPGAEFITGGHTGENRTSNAQRTTVNDGEKDYALFTQVRWVPGTREGEVVVEPTVVGRSVDVTVVCEDGNCTFSSGGTPAPSETIPVGGGDDDSSSSDSGGDSGTGADAGGTTDDARATADSADVDHSTDVGADGSSAALSVGADDRSVGLSAELAGLGDGFPDAATATAALLEQV